MSSDEAKKKLLDLPINILVHNLLTLFAESPLDIVCFGCTCKAAHKLANDARLWSNFCRNFPCPGHCPEVGCWNAVDSKHLYLALVRPYSHLLHHLWHSTTWPVGQLLKVDAEPPRLVANSLYYKSLNGGPYCHAVFAVELVQGQHHARVTCWRDRHGADGFESDAELRPALAPEPATAGPSSSSGTIAALDLAPAGSHSSAAAGPSINSSTAGPVNGPYGFVLSCNSRCDSVVTEFTNRKTKAKAYEEVRQKYLPLANAASSGSGSTSPISCSNDCSSTSTTSALLPLPDVQQSPTIELIHFITLSDMRPIFSTPVYRQLDLSPWISSRSNPRPSAWLGTGAEANMVDSPQPSAVAAHSGRVTSSDNTDLLVGSALGLTGMWRGTYGSHGVELLQLQLMVAPPGYDMFSSCSSSSDSNAMTSGAASGGIIGSAAAADGGGGGSTGSLDVAAAIAADNSSDGTPGVLLGGIAGMTDASSAADRTRLYAELPGEAAAAGAPAESLVVVYDNPAAADAEQQQQLPTQHDTEGVQAIAAAGSSSSSPAQQSKQLLLVATKLTGDMNVPVGRVSFAVHVGSQVPGGNELLQLSGGTDTDVKVNAPGTRQLQVKARYRGRAQIAFTGFQAPAVIAAELLVFTDSDALGLLWKKPVDSFSLFSRISQLP